MAVYKDSMKLRISFKFSCPSFWRYAKREKQNIFFIRSHRQSFAQANSTCNGKPFMLEEAKQMPAANSRLFNANLRICDHRLNLTQTR